MESDRLAALPREARAAACWQFREPRLNPVVPRPTTSSILDSNYIKERRRGDPEACGPDRNAGRQTLAIRASRRAARSAADVDDAAGRALSSRVSGVARGEGQLPRSRL